MRNCLIMFCLLVLSTAKVQAEDIPNNEIWYTSADGTVLQPRISDAFGAKIVSNTYDNGKGIIKFDSSVTSIGGFSDCSDLTSITIPNSVKSIGGSAFWSCVGLTSITIPDSVENIGISAFYYCRNLRSVTIPNTTSIASKTSSQPAPFDGCNSLVDVIVKINDWSVKNNLYKTFTDTGYKWHYLYNGKEINGDYELPSEITSLGAYALYQCTDLTSLTIPNSVSEIGNHAFDGCSNLMSISVNWNRPLSITSSIFDNVDKDLCTLYVPKGTSTMYMVAPVWIDFKNIVEMVAANNISLDAETKYINIGDTLRLHATIEPADAYNRNVVWSSSDESVAIVDKNGLITAIKEGDATITVAIVGTDIKASCNISIRSTDVTGVELNTNQITFNAIGESVQLTATVEPENAANKNVTWKSSNESVCVVSPQGKVVAVGYGSAAIIATTVDGGYISACSIKVAEPVETPEDVNRDGKVNATDAMLIYNYILSH